MSEMALCSEEGSDDGVWDDTLLIKAYSKAINASEERVHARKAKEKSVNNSSSSSKHTNDSSSAENERFWKVGMPCRAVYSVDGKEYEATVEELNYENGTCTVVYVGYENVEEVDIHSLKMSSGEKARKLQDQVKNNFKEGFIPPPPTIPILDGMPMDESDAFSAMLMSWYMSGYHTGYYHGLKDRDARRNSHHQSS
ncbi:survival motor neuron protein isoform X2 [Cimex lectularius]|uniref:Tudor domain-containing protein n=1 Tax=Cimex lectularius TaxID=79782 RepID=A0A8I6RMP2_CIMLE|nr:survival motor neuron protein isoform X2 [Cimex lectularius]